MARQKVDPRWTLTPEGAVIVVGADGFSLVGEGKAIVEVRWSQVRQIAACTRFRQAVPELCLLFAQSPRRNDQVVVHERVPGWDDLCATLPTIFPSADAQWHA